MLDLELYKTEKSKNLIKYSVILGIVFIGIYILYPEINKITFAILIIVFILYLAFTEKKRQSIGKLCLDYHKINIVTDIKDIQLQLSEIENIEIVYSGYKGKKVNGDFIPRYNKFSGIDNYIKIMIDNKKYEYNILFEDITQENEIIGLVEKWAEYGYDISKIRINR